MNGHQVLLGIAILCELGATGLDLWTTTANRFNLMALGLVFYFISLLVP
jgi:hypothetical protein